MEATRGSSPNVMLHRHRPAIHFVLQTLNRRARQMPGQPLSSRTPASDLILKKRVQIIQRIDLNRRRVRPGLAQYGHPPLHAAEYEDRLLAHPIGAGVTETDHAFAIGPGTIIGLAAARDHEGT